MPEGHIGYLFHGMCPRVTVCNSGYEQSQKASELQTLIFCCARHLRHCKAQIKLEVKAEAASAMAVYRHRHCGADGVQGIEGIRIPRLPFSNKNKKGNRTRPLASIDALKQWAKAQAVMLYGGEHLLRAHKACQESHNHGCPCMMTSRQCPQANSTIMQPGERAVL